MEFKGIIEFFKDNSKNIEVVKLEYHCNEYRLAEFVSDFDSEKSSEFCIYEYYDEIGSCFTYEVRSGVSDDILFQFDFYSDVGLFFDSKLKHYRRGNKDGKP